MKCPKCRHVNPPDAKECDDCGVQFVDIRGGRGSKSKTARVDLSCPFNDHGLICGKPGSLSDSVLGGGPWWCSEHFWLLKGRRIPDTTTPQQSYRDRWYAERGLEYESPKPGTVAVHMPPGHAPALREPGEDEDFRLNA